jgi:branched-chain amino acid aminotransferase
LNITAFNYWDGENWNGSQAELNRGFRYGDGVFETCKVIDGQVVWLLKHFERLLAGCKYLEILLDLAELENAFGALLSSIKEQKLSGTLRIWASRAGAGTYAPISNAAELRLQFIPGDGVFEVKFLSGLIPYQTDILANSNGQYKTMNGLPYIRASNYAKSRGVDELILLNHLGKIAEGITSNLFLVKNNLLITPSLDQGCIAGIQRKSLLDYAIDSAILIEERPIALTEITDGASLFYTNSHRFTLFDSLESGIKLNTQIGEDLIQNYVAYVLRHHKLNQ